MAYGQRSWIAAHLLADPVDANKVVEVRSQMVLFGSTAGPFGGIGGAAMTYFQMTLVSLPNLVLVFADDRLLGWAGDETGRDVRVAFADIDQTRSVIRELLQPADTCPVPVRT